MSRWRTLRYWISGSARRAEDREIQEELEALRQFAAPGELGNLTLAAEDARAQFDATTPRRQDAVSRGSQSSQDH